MRTTTPSGLATDPVCLIRLLFSGRLGLVVPHRLSMNEPNLRLEGMLRKVRLAKISELPLLPLVPLLFLVGM